MGIGLAIGKAAVSSGLNTALGIGMSKYNSELNYNNAKRLQDDAYRKQRELYRMTYNDQSYKSQVEQMKAAGLSPSLMYSNGASGGGSGSASSVNMGNAGSVQAQVSPLDILGAQRQGAEIKLLEAQANLANTQANKTGGVDTDKARAETGNIEMDTKLKGIDAKWRELQNEIANTTKEFSMSMIKDQSLKILTEREQAQEQLEMLKRQNKISEETYNEQVEFQSLQNQNLASQILQRATQNKLTEQQADMIAEQMKFMWAELSQEAKIADANNLSKYLTELMKSGNTIDGSVIQIVKGAFQEINTIFGGKNEDIPQNLQTNGSNIPRVAN